MLLAACKSLSNYYNLQVVLKTLFDINYIIKAYLVSSNDSFFTWRRSEPLLQLQNISNITHVVNLKIKNNLQVAGH